MQYFVILGITGKLAGGALVRILRHEGFLYPDLQCSVGRGWEVLRRFVLVAIPVKEFAKLQDFN